jgi:hypothetical protein
LERIVQNPKEGQKTGFDPNAWRAAIEEPRKPEKSHWVWIEEMPTGRNKIYEEQQKLARAQSAVTGATKCADVSGLIDTMVTAFMEKIRSGKSCCEHESEGSDQITWIRVNEQTKGWRICLSFAAAGLRVLDYNDNRTDDIAALVARKSFGR